MGREEEIVLREGLQGETAGMNGHLRDGVKI